MPDIELNYIIYIDVFFNSFSLLHGFSKYGRLVLFALRFMHTHSIIPHDVQVSGRELAPSFDPTKAYSGSPRLLGWMG